MKRVMWLFIAVGIFLSGCATNQTVEKGEADFKNKEKMTKVQQYQAEFDQLKAAADVKDFPLIGKLVVFPSPVQIKRNMTVGEVITKAFDIRQYVSVFRPVDAANQRFLYDTEVNTSKELAREINRLGYFFEVKDRQVIISKLKTVKYQIGFIEKTVEDQIKSLIHNQNAVVTIDDTLGIMELTDDITGHRRVRSYIKSLKKAYLSRYYFVVSIKDTDKDVDVFRSTGTVTPMIPAKFMGGELRLLFKNGRILVMFQHMAYMSPVSFIIEKGGGEYTARQYNKVLKISLIPMVSTQALSLAD